MADIPFTDVIQSAYERAKKDFLSGKLLPIRNVEDLCHMAHSYAIIDLYGGAKKADRNLHYSKPIDDLYKLFDEGTISISDTYASFTFCYLKVYEVEGIFKKSTLVAQFEHEKKKSLTSRSSST